MTTISYIKNIKRVQSRKDVYQVDHFSIIVYSTSSRYVEGDQRSRDFPGHGYPGGYEQEQVTEHFVTIDESALKQAVEQLKKDKADFIFFKTIKKMF